MFPLTLKHQSWNNRVELNIEMKTACLYVEIHKPVAYSEDDTKHPGNILADTHAEMTSGVHLSR